MCYKHAGCWIAVPGGYRTFGSLPTARQYFLFYFLLDMEDCIQNLMDEFIVERNEI